MSTKQADTSPSCGSVTGGASPGGSSPHVSVGSIPAEQDPEPVPGAPSTGSHHHARSHGTLADSHWTHRLPLPEGPVFQRRTRGGPARTAVARAPASPSRASSGQGAQAWALGRGPAQEGGRVVSLYTELTTPAAGARSERGEGPHGEAARPGPCLRALGATAGCPRSGRTRGQAHGERRRHLQTLTPHCRPTAPKPRHPQRAGCSAPR